MPRERQQRFVPFPARVGYLAMTMMDEPVRKATRIATGKRVATRRPVSDDVERRPGGPVPEPDPSPPGESDGEVVTSRPQDD